MILSANLKKLRGSLTLEKWAEELGCNMQTAHRWEKGGRWPHREMLVKIAEKFNLQLHDLFRSDLFTGGLLNRSSPPLPPDCVEGTWLYIAAQNQGETGTIAVTIWHGSDIFRTATSSGAYSIATASGTIN